MGCGGSCGVVLLSWPATHAQQVDYAALNAFRGETHLDGIFVELIFEAGRQRGMRLVYGARFVLIWRGASSEAVFKGKRGERGRRMFVQP